MNLRKKTLEQKGSSLFFTLVALFLLFILGSIIAAALSKSMFQTRRDTLKVRAFSAAEAAANKGMFYAESKIFGQYGDWQSFLNAELYTNMGSPSTHTDTIDGIPVEFWFEDNLDVDGTDALGQPIVNQNIDTDEFIWVYTRAFPPDNQPPVNDHIPHVTPGCRINQVGSRVV